MDFRQHVRDHLPPLVIARETEIVDELAEHLSDVYEEHRAAGLDHEAARRRAAAALPRAARAFAAELEAASRGEAGRAADHLIARLDEPVSPKPGVWTMFTDLRQDFRLTLRTIVHAPGFTAVVVLILALGIGATTTIFSAADALLLRSGAIAGAEQVVSVYSLRTDAAAGGDGEALGVVSYPDYVDLRDSGALDGLAAYARISASIDVAGVAEMAEGEVVTGNYFDVLGIRAALGRTFTAGEDRPGSPNRVVVLSHATWVERFGADPGIVGRSIALNRQPYAVIGVAPAGFGGVELGDARALWVPMALQPEVRPPSAGPLRRTLGGLYMLDARTVRWLTAVGRLHDGQRVAEASAALDVVGRRLAAAYPASNRDVSATAVPLNEGPGVRSAARPLVALLGGAVLLLLLIACANVAGLLLTRTASRRREVAVRVALGATRWQLARLWLTEAVTLGVLGAAGGVIVAMWGTPILYGLGIPDTIDISVNGRVLAFALGAGIVTGCLFGLAPILHLAKGDAMTTLREEGGSVVASARATRLRRAFVVAQVALSLVLLVSAGLLIRTLLQAYRVDLGYEVGRMLVAEVAAPDGIPPEAGQAVYAALLDRVNALPGVRAAGAARVTVLSGSARTTAMSLDGQPLAPDRSNVLLARTNVVSQRYLDAMGIPVVRGRPFLPSDVDGAPRVAIVSRSLADRVWPDEDPIGRTLVWSRSRAEVIGVVADSVYLRPTERDPRPFFYVPLAQNYETSVTLHVRTTGDALAALPALRLAASEIDPRLVIARPRRLADEFDRAVREPRTLAVLAALFSGTALLLAAVGLYGVMAYAARQRTAEIGLRMALGATPGVVMAGMLRSGAILVGAGTVIGLVGAGASVRYVQSRLFGVAATDPATWLGTAGVLLAAGLTACAIPALRAMRTDPADALRRRT